MRKLRDFLRKATLISLWAPSKRRLLRISVSEIQWNLDQGVQFHEEVQEDFFKGSPLAEDIDFLRHQDDREKAIRKSPKGNWAFSNSSFSTRNQGKLGPAMRNLL